MTIKILIIDDDNLVCLSLKKILVKMGYEVETCIDATEAFTRIEQFEPDLVLLDIYLTVADGLDVLKDIKKRFPHIAVIMITAFSDVKIAVKAMKSGAYDFLLKPVDIEQLQLIIEKCVENLNLKREVEKYRLMVGEDDLNREFFGKSRSISRALNIAERLAQSDDTTVLIEGESGVGKEVFAKYLHQQSKRANKVFISINCAAIPKELAESELFGHEKGAFTGASQKTKQGKFELANNGTLLLDEIGELSLDLQVKLLRVLQEKKFYRLGGEKEIKVNVRVIAATNKKLEEEVKKERFREDLFYRLNVAKITIPPLRERQEDIPLLVYAFMNEFAEKFNVKVDGISPEALEMLKGQSWKGNIRELRNVMERALLLLDGDELREDSFDFVRKQEGPVAGDTGEFVLRIPKKGVEIDKVLRTLITQTLEITGGNQVRAAKVLGLSRSKLRYRMEQLGIEVTKKIGS